MLYNTKVTKRTDMEYQKFIGICNEVLPLKIETPYISLTNDIEIYLSALRTMNYNDTEAYDMGIESGKLNSSIKEQSEAESNILKRVKEITQKDSFSSFDYEELMHLGQMGKELVLKTKNGLNIINRNQSQTISKNELSSEMQNNMFKIISSIKDELKIISGLDLEDNKRLDNLEIASKHINQIADLNIGDQNKKYALDLLEEFLNTRKNAFRAIEEFAFHILEKFQKRETDFLEDKFEKYRLSVIALEALDLSDGVFSKGNYIFNDAYSDELLTTSKIYNAYMNGEDISPEMFKMARKKEMDYHCNILINEVERAVKRQPNNEFNM